MPTTRNARWVPVLLLLAVAAAAPASADRKQVVRDESKAFPVDGARELRIDVSVGEVHVDPVAGDRVEAHLKLLCNQVSRRCRERADRLRLEPTRSGDSMRLEMRGYDREERRGLHRPEVELHLSVPPAFSVAVDMGVGELELAGIEGDVTVDLGVGEVRVRVPEAAVKSVGIDVGVGEARLTPRPEGTHRSGFLFLGNEVDWRDGDGHSRIAVDVGVGEASVHLTP
jgi:hypothetical protein